MRNIKEPYSGIDETGDKIVPEEDVLKAILWYRTWPGEKTMYILNKTGQKQNE